MSKCEFTEIIHSRGWKVKEACELWDMSYDSWRVRCRNPKLRERTLSMCKGLEVKE